MSIIVLVADSQRLVGQALAEVLRSFSGLDVVEHIPLSGQEVLDAVREFRPDVAVIDYWIVGMDGPATTRSILSQDPECKVLLLSWFHGPDQIHSALAAGAAGFLPKSITIYELADAIRMAHEGSRPVLAERLGELVKTIAARQSATEEIAERLASLTRKEVSVLNALKYGQPLEDVASALFISLPTVKSHIRSILKKTGARTRAEAVAMALHSGLIQV